jgi:hypothetical protein
MFKILIAAVLLSAYVAWTLSRSREVLDQWAQTNQFEIIHAEFRNIFQGPFSFRTTQGQSVYYVKIRDRNGYERSGWVRCGGFLTGIFSDKVEVRWEDV